MAKLRITSDWHLEFWRGREEHALSNLILPEDKDDGETILVIAGDVTVANTYDRLAMVLSRAVERFRLVVFDPGNHDYWRQGEAGRAEQEMAGFWNALPNGQYLPAFTHVALDGETEAIGRTLWTDLDETRLLARADGEFADYRFGNGLRASWTYDQHCLHRQEIADFLTRVPPSHVKNRIVVTHHMPSYESVHRKYTGSGLNGYFASRLDHLVAGADLWVHGHTHDCFDYRMGRCRVVCNPFGYPGENPNYDPWKVVEL